MACDITAGRNDSNCLDSLGGIKAIYILNFAKGLYADAFASTDPSGQQITTLNSLRRIQIRTKRNKQH